VVLNLVATFTSWDDSSNGNNPRRRLPDWQRQILGVDGGDASGSVLTVLPGDVVTAFSGVRTLTYDGTTQFALALVSSGTYRLTWTGTGTAPGFRTARALSLVAATLTLVAGAGQTLTVTASTGAVFGAVQVGDEVFVPGLTTGDPASPFPSENEGRWVVLTASSTTLVLTRPADVAYSASSGTALIAADTDFQVYSQGPVQVGDRLDVVAGFAASAQKNYSVTAVTARRLEFVYTSALADQTLIPGAASLQVYSSPKRVVYVEANQEVALRYNGDTGDGCRVTPFVPGDPEGVGFDFKTGATWSLVVKNRSSAKARVLVVTAE
jgi:hypothetical protein